MNNEPQAESPHSSPQSSEDENVFEIRIDFERNSEHPAAVFDAMSKLIRSVAAVDTTLAASFDLKIESVQILDDIRTGSLLTRLRNALHSVDDEAIKELDWKKAIGGYLVRAKHKLIAWMDEKKTITSRQDLVELSTDLQRLAECTDIKKMPFYTPISLPVLLADVRRLSEAIEPLRPSDAATFSGGGATTSFPKGFAYDHEAFERLLTKEEITNETNEILKVKKPDYLGTSMWDLRKGERTFHAKIEDLEWLARFQRREIDVRPGDSLRVLLETTAKYGFDGEEVGVTYRVLRVLEVILGDDGKQLLLPQHS